MKILDFHLSKTHSEYQEQPYPLKEKTTIAFLDPPKKMHACS